MSNNIYLELLEKIKDEFNLRFIDSKKIEKLNQLLFDKKATYQEANELAVEVGEILKDVFGENITENILEDGILTEEIANILIRPNMMKNYDIVSTYSTDVQQLLNRQSGIGLKAMKPPVNKDRIDGIVKKIAEKEFNDTKWLLEEPIINFTQSVVDDTIKHNTELQYKSGLKPKIKRKEFGKCCDWCRQVVGEYNYPDVPDDVYKRHRYCRCTVEYVKGSKIQNVHTKRFLTKNEVKEREKRKSVSSDIKYLNRKDDAEQYRRYASVLGYENMPKSLPLFQEIKYNNIIDYDKLKSRYYVKNNIKKGVWGKIINTEKQAPHNELTREIGKSYLFKNVNAQELFDRYAGRGILEKDRKGNFNNKELCEAETIIGIDGRSNTPTNKFKIHHSKNRTHIVPYGKKE